MKKYICLILLGVFLLVYFLIGWFFSDVLLYLIGGAIGSVIRGWINLNMFVFLSVWVVLLLTFVFIYAKFNVSGMLDFVFVVIIALLLTIVEVFVYELISFDDEWSQYLHLGISVLSKSLLLTWMVCSKYNWLKKYP